MAGATLNDEILIPALEENFPDDPYGTATYVIRNTIHRALKMGAMGVGAEEENLKTLEETLRRLDNA